MSNYYIGDVHGRNNWKAVKAVVKPEDHVYFTGDYFDSRTLDDTIISFDEQLKNFFAIMDWGYSNSNVHLCIGNHDIQYINPDYDKTTDYMKENARKINSAFIEAADLLRFAYTTNDGYVASHAGIDQRWIQSVVQFIHGFSVNKLNERLEPNDFKRRNDVDLFWVRPEDFQPVEGLKQVVGHTPAQLIENADEQIGEYKRIGNVWYVDTYGVEDALVIEDTPPTKTTVDKRAVMKKAAEYRKMGFNKSESLTMAWSEYKKQL